MKIDIEFIKALDPSKVYVVELPKDTPESEMGVLRDWFVKVGMNILVYSKGSMEFKNPKGKVGS